MPSDSKLVDYAISMLDRIVSIRAKRFGSVTPGLTRPRAAEEQLRLSEQRFHHLVDAVIDYAIFMLDPAGHVSTWNSGAHRVKGYTGDEIIGRHFSVFYTPEDRAAGRPDQILAAVLRDGRYEDESWRVRNDGTHFWANVVITALRDERGTLLGFAKVTRDLTARREAAELERKLMREQTAREVAEAAGAAERSLRDRERRERRHSQYLADATAALGSSLRFDEMLSLLAGVLVPDLADWCGVHLVEGDGLRDVSPAPASETARALASDYRRRFGSGAPGDALTALLQGERAQLHDHLAGTGDPGTVAGAVLLAPIRIRNRALGTLGLVSSAPGCYRPAEITLAEELGRRAGIALENAQLYTAAQNAANLAEEASRAKDEFLATVSHELRTPLNAVLGWATILRQRVTDPSLIKPIEVIHRNAQAQASIIDDILDVSSVVTGKFRIETKPTDLVTIVRDALEVVRPSSVAKQIELLFEPASETCPLVADAERLQQVVWNLLSNAVKFTSSGGSVRLTLKRKAATVVLTVTDTGRGIDPAFLPDVFDRFKQGDSSIRRRLGGLGLGLALVRHISELHGGHVSAASEGVGQGATFTIVLPIRSVVPVESGAVEPERAVAASNAKVLSGVRVLIVDDEPDARDLVATVLSEAGALVHVAGSAAEGFSAFKRFRPEVLVSDIGMPGADGYALMERIRALTSAEGGRIASLALTAFAREEDRTQAIRSGFTTHVGKPVNPDALTAAVANLAHVARAR